MRPRIFLTAVFVVGLLAGQSCFKQTLMGLAALCLWAVWTRDLTTRQIFCTSLLALSLGLARAELDDHWWEKGPDLPPGPKAELSGKVMESPRKWGKSLVFLFEIESIDGRPSRGPIVLVRWSNCEESVETGDHWALSGRITEGEEAAFPGGFSQQRWLWTQRARGVFLVGKFDRVSFRSPPIGWGPSDLAAKLRLVMHDRLDAIQDTEARALISGVVFGDTQALPKEIAEMFRRTGTSHLLAASGMNVALLIGIFAALARLRGYGAWRIAPALIPLVIAYAYLAGCAPSITRAATAGSLSLLASWLGRRSGAWNSLCLSIWILLLWEPRQLHDLGFGLSVAAVVGLLAGPKLPESSPGWCKNALLTLSASLLTLPFMWLSFHEISLTFLPANLLLGPLVETLFPLGLLLTLCPLPPLYWVAEGIAKVSLFLVKVLSETVDPHPLVQPGEGPLLLLFLAIALWLGAWRKGRWLALPLAAMALMWAQKVGLAPRAAPGELVVRRIGTAQPYYWLSSHREELLVLSAAWQEGRARQSVVAMGCSRPVQIKILEPDRNLSLRWGAFQWERLNPFLTKVDPYLEVRTNGRTYLVKTWRPSDEYRDSTISHRLGKPRGEFRPDSERAGSPSARTRDTSGPAGDVLHRI